jgi:hypothetical protein
LAIIVINLVHKSSRRIVLRDIDASNLRVQGHPSRKPVPFVIDP